MRLGVLSAVSSGVRQNRNIEHNSRGQQLPELLRHQLIADVAGAHAVINVEVSSPLHVCKERLSPKIQAPAVSGRFSLYQAIVFCKPCSKLVRALKPK